MFSAAAVAVGLLISSLTDSQAVAFFITFFVLFLLWFSGMVEAMGGTLANVIGYISFQSNLDGFARGLVDTRNVIYFLSVTAIALVVAFRALERRKWA